MKYMKFNERLFLWREDIEDSVLLYRIGGEKIFTLKGGIRNIFLELISQKCNLEDGKVKEFFIENRIFEECVYNA
ncbi:hypothetical protein [Tepidibacter thalassicus]|uniref:Uncharacterized protein n=1 Tax=Tepidibacter thalassicus DSM 15285 TaxID=1123350 RepID=A0A1M5SY58_9FIRM|nr:hypothetical protein [Tepidibacter thalassicus]SHH43406.1 hypothetical protein SAMN02744040_01963 [Tepidibacter thalassicus DSM 15285]